MPHSYTQLLYHLVFSTKRREPFLGPSVLPRLCEYLGGAVRGEGGTALIVNGMPDHIHILARLRQDVALSDVLRAIKAHSSGWVHDTFPELSGFAWQSGYGAFTVSISQADRVRHISNVSRSITAAGRFRRSSWPSSTPTGSSTTNSTCGTEAVAGTAERRMGLLPPESVKRATHPLLKSAHAPARRGPIHARRRGDRGGAQRPDGGGDAGAARLVRPRPGSQGASRRGSCIRNRSPGPATFTTWVPPFSPSPMTAPPSGHSTWPARPGVATPPSSRVTPPPTAPAPPSRTTRSCRRGRSAPTAPWRRLAGWGAAMGSRLAEALLAPLPALRPALRWGRFTWLAWDWGDWPRRRGSPGGTSAPMPGGAWCPAVALHVDLGPNDFAGAGLGLVLALLASTSGFRVPVGGTRAITAALLRHSKKPAARCASKRTPTPSSSAAGGRWRCEPPRATKSRCGGPCWPTSTAPSLFLRLLPAPAAGGWVRRSARRFRFGWGTFKMDWALSGPVPWSAPEAAASAVVHTGDSLDDLIAFTRRCAAATCRRTRI